MSRPPAGPEKTAADMKDLLSVCTFFFLLACLSPAVVPLSAALEIRPPVAPARCHGRQVRDWLEDARSGDHETRQEAFEAFDSMGPSNRDAIPELVYALSHE